jgi:phage terminase large subunit-like protein
VWRRMPGSRLEVSPGAIVDHDLIYEQFVTTLMPKFKPSMVGYDQHNARQFGIALRDKARLTAVEVAQGRRLSEAFKWFEALVMAQRIIHDGDPILAWCVSNCEAQYDRYRNMWVEKPSATKRIDGAMAAVMALYLMLAMPKAPEYQILIVGGRR